MIRYLVVLCGLLWSAQTLAQDSVVVRATTEFTERSLNPGSAPSYLTVANNQLYFAANDGIHGTELWSMDRSGTARLVCDFNPGPLDSNPRSITQFDNSIVFLADGIDQNGDAFSLALRHPLQGRCATALPYDTALDTHGPDPDFCVSARPGLFLDYRSLDHGRELWCLNSLNGLVAFVRDTLPGPEDGLPALADNAWKLGDGLLFKAQYADDPVPGSYRLWVSDGTFEGTYCLLPPQPIPVGRDHGEARNVQVAGENAYFEGSHNHLWMTDGTREGTRKISDVTLPKEFCDCGGIVYFQADDGEHGSELWRTDGTADGTRMVKDINRGPAPSGPYFIRSLGDFFLFNADDGVHGYELWRSDGTSEGTRLVKDLYEGPTSSNLYQPTVYEDYLLFAADHPVYGEELWRSDGTTEGTVLVKDINRGPGRSEPYYLTVFNGLVYFSAADSIHGEELWCSDGTTAGTQLVADINPKRRIVRSSNPANLYCIESTLYFVADDVAHGAELWQSNLVTDDTDLVKDINPGPGHADPQQLTALGNLLFFTADDGENGRGLYRTDGGAEAIERVSTWPLDAAPGTFQCLTPVDGSLLFAAIDPAGAGYVFRLDAPYIEPIIVYALEGSMANGKVRRISISRSSIRVCVECEDGRYRFLVANGLNEPFQPTEAAMPIPVSWEWIHRTALSDDEAASEEWLENYLSTPEMAKTKFVWWNDTAYFAAYSSGTGVELWRSGHDSREAELVRDLLPGPASSSPSELIVYHDTLYFAAEHGTNGRELWRSDGTGAGTFCVNDFAPGKSGGDPAELMIMDDTLVLTIRRPTILNGAPFLAILGAGGTIRSLAGRNRYGSVWPVNPNELTVAGNYIYFRGTGFSSGNELWRSSTSPNSPTLVRNILDDTSYDSCRELYRRKD